MSFIYNFLINTVWFALQCISPFNKKIDQFTKGRKQLHESNVLSNPIWFHCASVGEFEQAKPIIEHIKLSFPSEKILLTFFSPSGFKSDSSLADLVSFSPFDTPKAVKSFLELHRPKALFLVKYEFWKNLISISKKESIPIFSVSSNFRSDQRFFGKIRGLFIRDLKKIDHFFVQNDKSLTLLNSIGINEVTVTGDTRFDRVIEIAENSLEIDQIHQFSDQQKVIVAGSTWPKDDIFLRHTLEQLPSNWKLIVAPHEIHAARIDQIKNTFSQWSCLNFSGANSNDYLNTKILIIDSIGLLNRIYRYGTLAYVGGGFGAGLHNILEAAVWGKTIIHGPNYNKFNEAIELKRLNGTFNINSTSPETELTNNIQSEEIIALKSSICKDYVYSNMGATKKVINHLTQNGFFD